MPAPASKTANSAKEKPAKKREVKPPAAQKAGELAAIDLQRTAVDPPTLRPAEVLALQRKLGNRTVTQLVQAKPLAATITPAAERHSEKSGTIQRETYDKTWESSYIGGWYYGVSQKKTQLQDHFTALRAQIQIVDDALKAAPRKDKDAYLLGADGLKLKALREYERQSISWSAADALLAGAGAKLQAARELAEGIAAALSALKTQREIQEAAEAEEKRRQRETQQVVLEQQRREKAEKLAKQREEEERQRKEEAAAATKRAALQKVLPMPLFATCLNQCGGNLDLLESLVQHIKAGEGGKLQSSLSLTAAAQLLDILKVHQSPIDMINKLLVKLGAGQGAELEELLGKIDQGQEPVLLKLLTAVDADKPNPTKVGELLDVENATAPKLSKLLETDKVLSADLYNYLITEAVPFAKLEAVLRSCTAAQLKELFGYGKLGIPGATGETAVDNLSAALGKLADAEQILTLMKAHSGLPAATMLRIVGAHLSAGNWDPSAASVATILYHYKRHVIDEGGGGGPAAKDVEAYGADTAGPLAQWHTGRVSPQGDGWKITGPPGGNYNPVTRKPFTFWYV
jgi:hypothetical protein